MELLIVIAIVGILAAVVLVTSMQGAAQSRDGRRIKEVYQIGRALQQYYTAFAEYPISTSDGVEGCSDWDVGNHHSGDGKFIQSMVDIGFTEPLPLEWTDTLPCNYRYRKGACGCLDGAILFAKCETNHCPEEERPDCCNTKLPGCSDVCATSPDSDKQDIFIYFE